MSAIIVRENRLFNHKGNHTEELGFIGYDDNSKSFVLWLKDICDSFGLNGGYRRGDEYLSLEDATQNAAASKSAFAHHLLWLQKIATAEQKNWRAIIEVVKRFEKFWDEHRNLLAIISIVVPIILYVLS